MVSPRPRVAHNVAKTCRYYGIARRTYYFWGNRYQEKGIEGLKDRSKRPIHGPRATKPEIIEKIVYLRGIIILVQRPHASLAGRTPFERLQEKLKELSLTKDTL